MVLSSRSAATNLAGSLDACWGSWDDPAIADGRSMHEGRQPFQRLLPSINQQVMSPDPFTSTLALICLCQTPSQIYVFVLSTPTREIILTYSSILPPFHRRSARTSIPPIQVPIFHPRSESFTGNSPLLPRPQPVHEQSSQRHHHGCSHLPLSVATHSTIVWAFVFSVGNEDSTNE